ncbi:MAG: hypothetical protein HRU38_19620 [Saccharospirillaceae bacterium]|nr:hypothetical protein [Pseudomonadales bacterium]NRB80846.1 hypothetical protein [Saccharospirillaceae bacterium]
MPKFSYSHSHSHSSTLVAFLIYSSCLFISSCAEPVTPPIDEGVIEILHQLNGNVAVGVAAQYSEVCTFHATKICTRANSSGDYVLSQVTGNQGWLEANYINPIGELTTLHSAYFINDEVNDAIVNINPSTDIISQIWLAHTQLIDIETCLLEDCLTSTNSLITQNIFEVIETNLSTILSPFWPESLGSIRTSDYIADPVANELDLMHELINYVLDVENGNLEIRDNNNNLIAQNSIADLTSLDIDPLEFNDVVLESEMQASLPFRRAAVSGFPAINIALIINPSTVGQAPFDYEINTSGTYSTLPNAVLSFEHIIIAPDSSITLWSENIHTGTLIIGGTHEVIVEVTADTGEQAIMGASIDLDRDEDTPATYGSSGSCRPDILDNNSLNICIELLDGGQLKNCDENDEFIEVNNRCSQSSQLEGTFIGNCELVDNQLNRNHYQNPLRFSNETLAQQQSRLQTVCEADFGIWF